MVRVRKSRRRGRKRSSRAIVYLKRRQVNLSTSFSSVNTSWIIEDVPLTTAGTDIANRIGRAIRLSRFVVRGMVVGGQSNLVTDDPYNAFRIVIFVGRPELVSADWAARTIDDPVYPGVDGVNRCLFDKILNLQVPAADSTGYVPATRQVDYTFNLNTVALYGTNVAAVPQGGESLYLAMISDSAAASNPGFTSGYYVLFFRDCA